MNKSTLISMKKYIFSPYSVVILFLILFIIRILYLDADPFFLKRFGDIGDEGYWAYNARNAFLFNRWIIDGFNQSLATAPLYSALVYLSFKLFGLGYSQVRLVSALLSWSTLVVLYFFIKDVWNRKSAIIAVIILGFNSVFLMYNRLGLVESSMIFFLVLTFYFFYKGNTRNIFHILAGFTFSMAILTKITVFYFIPAIIIFWILEKIRGNLELRNIIYFVVSALIPLFIFATALLIPYWTELSPFLISVSEGQKASTLNGLILNFQFNYFFGLLPIFILLIPLILYFTDLIVKLDLKSFHNIKSFLIKRDFIEIIIISWIIGGSLGLLFSDLADRRLLMLIIPLTLIFTKIILDKSKFDLNLFAIHTISLIYNSKNYIKFILASLLILPIYSFSVVIRSIYPFSSFINHYLHLVDPLIYLIVIVLFICLILPSINKKIISAQAIIVLISMGCLISSFLLNFVGITYSQYMLIFGIKSSLMISLIINGVPLIILFAYLLISFIWRKDLLKITPKFTYVLLVLYLIVNFAIIGVQFANPTFTIAENSKDLQNYAQKGDVFIGPWSHELSLKNEILPIWYLPNNPSYATINQNISKYHPKFILVAKVFNSQNTNLYSSFPKLSKFPDAKFVKSINLCPYPYTHEYRAILYLYKINN